jgi:hypothetical protein
VQGAGRSANFVVVRESRATTLKPANVSHEQAAAIPVPCTHRAAGLARARHLKPGQKVLINGASGEGAPTPCNSPSDGRQSHGCLQRPQRGRWCARSAPIA